MGIELSQWRASIGSFLRAGTMGPRARARRLRWSRSKTREEETTVSIL